MTTSPDETPKQNPAVAVISLILGIAIIYFSIQLFLA